MSSPNPSSPSKTSDSSPSAFEDTLISFIALSAVFTAVCLIRCFIQHMAAQSIALSSSDKQRNTILDSDAIAALPTFTYRRSGDNEGGDASKASVMECPICLSVVQEGEVLKLLPRCKHSFHGSCVDLWLKDHGTCPFCRMPVLRLASVTNPPSQIEMEEPDLERQS